MLWPPPMANSIPNVERYMSPAPHTIGVEQDVAQARTVMRTHSIRHLPVLHGGTLVGLVSERELDLAARDGQRVPLEDAMMPAPYVVEPGTPLDEVAATMAERKYGSVVVARGAKVVGVLTTVDVCRALVDALRA